MGQTESPNQALLRHIRDRECRQNSDLDRRIGLRLIAIVKKELKLDASLYTLLQIFCLSRYSIKCPFAKRFLASVPNTTTSKRTTN
jgi:hypothetical protein